MNKILNLVLAIYLIVCLSACDKADPEAIEGITESNYPKVDGSTSTHPLQQLIACKLLGQDYDWFFEPIKMHYTFFPLIDGEWDFASARTIKHSGTHKSFINLINGDADFIITARTASDDERRYADSVGVKLIETPIAMDAFIFILNENNTVNSLTTKQIQDIYTGKIENWSELGGDNTEIHPYKRNATSGSQVLMESLIMKNLNIPDMPEMEVSPTMWGPFQLLSNDVDGICYTVYYYKEFMARAEAVKHISVDGVYPDYNTLENGVYPYTTNVYAVIRGDLDNSSTAYNLYQWLLTEAGEKVIKESGYIPYRGL